MERPKEAASAPCWPISIFTMCSTCGPSDGGRSTPEEMSSSYGLPMMSCLGFQYRHDAERFLEEMQTRFKKFNLELHDQKTRLIEFGRFAAERTGTNAWQGKPETFAFLGFTHICSRSRLGNYMVLRKTEAGRVRRKLHEIKRIA